MKIDKDFKASSSFTHLHQLKSVGGDYSSIPMYTLTARKGTLDKLELRQTNTNDQETLKKVDLSLLKRTLGRNYCKNCFWYCWHVFFKNRKNGY